MSKLITIAAALMLIGGGCVAIKPEVTTSETTETQQNVSEKSKDNFSKKLKCKDLAEDWYEYDMLVGNMTYAYGHKYHEGMNTCIAYMHTYDPHIQDTRMRVTDLLTEKYILYYSLSSSGEENIQFFCRQDDSPCVSREAFEVRKDELFAE